MRKQLDLVLEQKIANPDMDLYTPLLPLDRNNVPPCSKLIQTIIDLITSEDYTDQKDRLTQGKHLYYRRY